MYKKLWCFVILASIGLGASAQSQRTLSVDLGGTLTSFQDNKFSQVRFRGAGGAFAIGYQRQNPQALWSARLQILAGSESAATHDQGIATTINPRVELRYLRKVKENLFLGAQWDVMDFYNKQFDGLGNNSNYYLTGSNLFASGVYEWNKFRFGLDVGVLAYAKEGTGFAFSAPQSATENGEFDYLDDALINPFRLKHGKITGFGPNLHLRTNIQYQLSDRWNLVYQWNFRRYVQVPGYAAYMGYNMLNVRFDIRDKNKEGK